MPFKGIGRAAAVLTLALITFSVACGGGSSGGTPSPAAQATTPATSALSPATATATPAAAAVRPAPQAAPDPCRALPQFPGASLAVATPAADVPVAVARFSGVWAGFWGNSGASVLVIHQVQPAGASALYYFGPGPATPLTFALRPDGRLSFQAASGVAFAFSVSPDGTTLVGVRIQQGGATSYVWMDRCNEAGGRGASADRQPPPIPPGAECAPGDQDKYVVAPARLRVIDPCLRVTGVVAAVGVDPQTGNGVFDVTLDAPFRDLVNFANVVLQNGNLQMEVICFRTPALPAAVTACSSDTTAVTAPLPTVGQHVWVEGRYIEGLTIANHAELHPVYRWGVLSP